MYFLEKMIFDILSQSGCVDDEAIRTKFKLMGDSYKFGEHNFTIF